MLCSPSVKKLSGVFGVRLPDFNSLTEELQVVEECIRMYKIYRSSWIYVNILVYLTEAQLVGKIHWHVSVWFTYCRHSGPWTLLPQRAPQRDSYHARCQGNVSDSAMLRAYCRYLFLGDLVWTASGREVWMLECDFIIFLSIWLKNTTWMRTSRWLWR